MASDSVPSRSDPRGRRWKIAAAVVGVWSVVALVAGVQVYLAGRLAGEPVPLVAAFGEHLLEVAIFAAASPFIWLSAVRFPIRGPRRWAHLALHVVAGVAFVALLNVLAVVPWAVARGGEVAVREFFGLAAYGFTTHVHAALIVYFVIVGIAHLGRREPEEEPSPDAVALDRLTVEREGRVKLLSVDEIDWIEAAGDELRVHAADEVYRLRERLRTLEARLDPGLFARIHRSTIVNLDRIEELHHFSHGDYDVLLEDGTRLRMSRSYRDRVLADR